VAGQHKGNFRKPVHYETGNLQIRMLEDDAE